MHALPNSEPSPKSEDFPSEPYSSAFDLTRSLPPHLAALFGAHVVESHARKLAARLEDHVGDCLRRRRCAEIISQDLWENERR